MRNDLVELKKSKKEHIESYIFTPKLLSKEKRLEIKRWLHDDDELRAIADWYRSFKKEISAIDKDKAKKRPESSKIELFSAPDNIKTKYTFALAAKTTTKNTKKAGFATLRTFISEQEKTLVRVIKNLDKNHIQIHAISENIEADDIAMMRIPGTTDLMISKPGGIFSLQKGCYSDEMIKTWDKCLLFIPVVRADLWLSPETGSLFLDTHRSDKEKLNMSISEEENLIKVILKTYGNFYIDKVVASDGEKGYLLFIKDNVIDVPKSLVKNRFTSLFFFN